MSRQASLVNIGIKETRIIYLCDYDRKLVESLYLIYYYYFFQEIELRSENVEIEKVRGKGFLQDIILEFVYRQGRGSNIRREVVQFFFPIVSISYKSQTKD